MTILDRCTLSTPCPKVNDQHIADYGECFVASVDRYVDLGPGEPPGRIVDDKIPQDEPGLFGEGVEWWGTDCKRCGNAMPGDSCCDSCGQTDQMVPLYAGTPYPPLTPDEHRALQVSCELANLVHTIVGDGPMHDHDWNEMATAIHVVQRTIASQAAGRLWPSRYRLLGEVIPR